MPATLVRRGMESVRELGVRRTLETLLNHLEDRLFDLVNLTDTYTKVQQADLKVDSVNQAEAAPYFPTRGRAYREALAHFALPTDGGFVDLGSGKGKILILSARYGFGGSWGWSSLGTFRHCAIEHRPHAQQPEWGTHHECLFGCCRIPFRTRRQRVLHVRSVRGQCDAQSDDQPSGFGGQAAPQNLVDLHAPPVAPCGHRPPSRARNRSVRVWRSRFRAPVQPVAAGLGYVATARSQ